MKASNLPFLICFLISFQFFQVSSQTVPSCKKEKIKTVVVVDEDSKKEHVIVSNASQKTSSSIKTTRPVANKNIPLKKTEKNSSCVSKSETKTKPNTIPNPPVSNTIQVPRRERVLIEHR